MMKDIKINPVIANPRYERRIDLPDFSPESRMKDRYLEIELSDVGILFFSGGTLEKMALFKDLDIPTAENTIKALISKYVGERVCRALAVRLSKDFKLSYTLWEYQNERKSFTYPEYRGRIEPFLQPNTLPPTHLSSEKISEEDTNG